MNKNITKYLKFGISTAVVSSCLLFSNNDLIESPFSSISVEAANVTTYTTTANLNLRSTNSTKGKILLTIPKGKNVSYIKKSGNWYQVKYNGKTGWVSKTYIKTKNATTSTTKTTKTTKTYTTTANLNLRSTNSTKGKILLTIPKGKNVSYIKKSGNWYQVKYNSKTGWVSSSYIKTTTKTVTATSTANKTTTSKSSSTTKTSSTTYTVIKGDTLSGIAKKYGTTYQAIMNLNGLKSTTIKIGQKLKINGTASTSTTISTKAISIAKNYIGVPYVFGGATPKGFDCSGLIYYAFKNAGKSISRTTAAGYYNMAKKVTSPQVGDLVFFSNTYKKGISHVGIYLGNNQMISASGSKVNIESIKTNYWKSHFSSYGRL